MARPGIGGLFGGAVREFLAGLVLLAALILLAACANLGVLFASRAADRSRELEGLAAWQPFPEFPINVPVSPDLHVYGIALLLAVGSGLLFGAAPVREVLRTDSFEIVKSGSRSTPGRRLTVRDVLLAVQIAICAVLMTSSIVAIRGMARSLHSNLGIEPRNAMLALIDPTLAGYRGDRVPEMQQRMIEAMEAIPGVTSVGLVGEYPPLHMGWNNTNVFSASTTDLRPGSAATGGGHEGAIAAPGPGAAGLHPNLEPGNERRSLCAAHGHGCLWVCWA